MGLICIHRILLPCKGMLIHVLDKIDWIPVAKFVQETGFLDLFTHFYLAKQLPLNLLNSYSSIEICVFDAIYIISDEILDENIS